MTNPPIERGTPVPAGGDRFGDVMSRLEEAASREELQRMFRSHGMEVTGLPLEVE